MTNKIFLGLILGAWCLLALAQETTETAETAETAEATDTTNITSTGKDLQYVTDQLRLSLYQEPNAQSPVLKLLRSGDSLILDEIRGPYALVTSTDGVHGWVKRGFLVNNPTANILLQEEREKNASLFEEIEKLSGSKMVIDTYEKDMDDLVWKIGKLENEKQETQTAMDELKQELIDTQAKLKRRVQNNQPPIEVLWENLLAFWKLIVPLLLVMLMICYLVTKASVEARIKARFHGIKIW